MVEARARGEYLPIEDYALIGNCRTAALVSNRGSIDWLCLPRFDSPSLFGALLDARKGGTFSVAPTAPFDVTRRYCGESAVLETTFHTASGTARLTDLMPVASEPEKADELWPDHELMRLVECLDGSVDMEVLFEPRPNYAQGSGQLRVAPGMGILCEQGSQTFLLHSDRPLSAPAQGIVRGRATLRAGDQWALSLTYTQDVPAILSPTGRDPRAHIGRSVRWWETWMHTCTYDGPYADLVRRSTVTLKLLTYSPSGAIVAAPTTSLPEAIGGVRNWDYRYCWLRDASLTLNALFGTGHTAEGEAFLSWLLHATRVTWPELQVLYNVFGERRLTERTLDHFEGYRQSAPVRTGNGAFGQLQLDVYGEVIDAAWWFCRRGGQIDRPTERMLTGLGRTVMRRWQEPDEGIWEPRAGRAHRTHTKALCWVALDRLASLAANGDIHAEAETFTRVRDEIRGAIEAHGFNASLGSYVSVFGGAHVDASLLLLSLMGYADPQSSRMMGTVKHVRDRLGHNGLLYRYRGEYDGLPGGEGAFGLCSFWSVSARVLEGNLDLAVEEFEHLATCANDVGLYGEQIDPNTGAALGNFPQAFTHVGLINAALRIAEAVGWAPHESTLTSMPDVHDMGGHV